MDYTFRAILHYLSITSADSVVDHGFDGQIR